MARVRCFLTNHIGGGYYFNNNVTKDIEMKLVNSIDDYTRLLDECLNKSGVVYNHMLLPQHVEKFIREKHLHYEDYGESRVFFCDERDFYKLYCFLIPNEVRNISSKDKPQIIECIYKDKKDCDNKDNLHSQISDLGFSEYAVNLRVKAIFDNNNTFDINKAQIKEGVFWGHPNHEDIEDIYKIWESLDKYDSIIPRNEEMIRLVNDKELITLKIDNKVCAVAKIKKENRKTGSTWLVAVDASYRNQGLATLLYKVCFSFMREKGYRQAIQWCDKTNTPILNTIKKLGFELDRIISKEYILF